MNPADLQTVVDRALKRLPAAQAPRTLLPRIMAAVHSWTLRPWYQRAWFTWPIAAQAALVMGLIVLASAAAVAYWMTESVTAGALTSLVAGISAQAAGVAGAVEATAGAVRIIWGALVQPVVPYVFGLVVLMCFACAAIGAALNHVALERT